MKTSLSQEYYMQDDEIMKTGMRITQGSPRSRCPRFDLGKTTRILALYERMRALAETVNFG